VCRVNTAHKSPSDLPRVGDKIIPVASKQDTYTLVHTCTHMYAHTQVYAHAYTYGCN